MGTPRIVQGDERLAYTAGSTAEVVAPLGTKLVIEDGRTFRMAQCDTSTALVNANTVTSPAPSANFRDEDVGTMAAGVRVLTAVGSTTGGIVDGALRGGYLTVKDTAQLDPIHRIKTNTAIVETSDRGTITLESDLQDAIASGEKITYIPSPWRQIIIAPTQPAALILGVTVRAMAVDVYSWIATSGPARVLEDGVLIVGQGAQASDNVAGSVEDWAPESDTGNEVEAMFVGTVMVIEGDTVKGLIYLKLDSN
jgi:hypothetical protein